MGRSEALTTISGIVVYAALLGLNAPFRLGRVWTGGKGSISPVLVQVWTRVAVSDQSTGSRLSNT